MTEAVSHLSQIVPRVTSLYSLPAVAMEVVKLTDHPHVDTHALKECIERDPALTAKVLRVVNSSLFGMRSEVADLNQALALLGTKPLKLLVLGFSLPDRLFNDMAAEQLQWYWTHALTRAVAARLLSDQLWHNPGDEAFVAGLLQDIGVLALLQELKEPYNAFLSGAIQERCNLSTLERRTLGFSHVELSAALLSHWKLPQPLVDAVAAPKQKLRLARLPSPDGDLPQILHLAELLSQLVGHRRLQVLPELVEAGKAYRGLTKLKLTSLVEELQPQVDQLADALAVELPSDRDYVQVLLEAHEQMSLVSEQLFDDPTSLTEEDSEYVELITESRRLSDAMDSFLRSDPTKNADADSATAWGEQHAPHRRSSRQQHKTDPGGYTATTSAMLQRLSVVASTCREHRQEISLLLVEPGNSKSDSVADREHSSKFVQRALDSAISTLRPDDTTMLALTSMRVAAILPNCERREALEVANDVIANFTKLATHDDVDGPPPTVSVGSVTVASILKNFDPITMLESAERCLYAALTCGTSAVKSIEN